MLNLDTVRNGRFVACLNITRFQIAAKTKGYNFVGINKCLANLTDAYRFSCATEPTIMCPFSCRLHFITVVRFLGFKLIPNPMHSRMLRFIPSAMPSAKPNSI